LRSFLQDGEFLRNRCKSHEVLAGVHVQDALQSLRKISFEVSLLRIFEKKGAAQPSSRHREAFYLGVLRACGVTRALGARRSASGALLFRKPRLELGSWFRAGTSTETVFGFFSCPTTSTSLLFSVFFVFVLVERKKNHVCQEFLSHKDIVV